jgi:uncharacterized membrane protein YeaQ/YmgE (transglycosylase-associated protein family)
MPLLLALLLIVVIIALFWVTANVLGVVVYLVIAGLVGALADAVVPGRIPFGWLGAILAGVIGSWIGVARLGRVGPDLAGIPVIPAIVGAVILAGLVQLIWGSAYRSRRVL